METISTESNPYDLYYLPWRKEVWVNTWANSTFNVISTEGSLEKTHKAIKTNVKPVEFTRQFLWHSQLTAFSQCCFSSNREPNQNQSKRVISRVCGYTFLLRPSPRSKWRRRNPWTRLSENFKTPGVFCRVKHIQMFLFRLNNDFRLTESKHRCQSLERTSKDAMSWIVCHGTTQGFLRSPFLMRECPGV